MSSTIYPATREAALQLASDLHGIPVDELIVGVHIGPEEPGGVGFPSDFEDYKPFRRIDSPEDGFNDGEKFVVYFTKEEKVYKAVNADPATLVELTSADPEFANISEFLF
jgi:hypothetical protein